MNPRPRETAEDEALRAAVPGIRLAVRAGNKAVVAGGLTLYCAALAWIATVSQGTSYALIAATGALLGTGMGLT